jgi:hypothetical protein
MMEATPEPLGPGPFRHNLPAGPVQGPAYSLAFRLLAIGIVLACSAGTAQLVWVGQLSGNGVLWSLSALAMMGWMTWHILRSRTTLSPESLHQTWVWDKHLALQELSYARIIRIPGLDWLIAPRLYARTLGGKFTVFYAASPALVAEFTRLQQAVRAHYEPR